MNPLHWLARPEFASLAAALLHFLWQGALIAVLLAAGKRLWRIERAAPRYACSLAALLAMAFCPVVTYFAAALAWQPPQALTISEQPRAAVAGGITSTSWPAPEALAHSAQPYLLAIWLAGVCVLGLRLAGGFVGAWRVSQRRLPLPLTIAERVEQLGKRLRIEALPRVFLSRHVSEALAVGFWRPVVLVPAAWVTEMPLEALEAVIAHELAHLRRLDLWVNLLQRVVETLFFYHPAVWWVSRQLREEREMCCDELAVGATGARLAYVEALELVARERLAGVRPALAAGIRGESNMKLLARVRNVLSGAGEESGSLWPAGLLALLLPLAMWGMTWGIFSPTPAVAVADEKREGDEVERKDREDGDRPRKDGEERKKEGEARDEERGERKEIRKDGDQPRKEGERRDGDQRKKGPRDGEARKEGPRDGDQPRKEGERRDGDQPKKKAPREGDAPKKAPREGGEVRKDPVKKEQLEGETPRKKIVREGDATRKDAGQAESKLEALVKELRAENEKLRAELRELRGDKAAGPQRDKQTRRDKELKERDELIKKFGESRDSKIIAEKRERVADEERAAIERKLQAVAEQKERAAREAAEAKERAAIKEREAAERKEREIERRRDEDRARADKEQGK